MTNDTTLIVMTGGTSGIGLESVRALARHENVHLVVGARATSDTSALRSAVPAHRLDIFELDTSSLASVRKFAEEVRDSCAGNRISAVGLNAGCQGGNSLQMTEDGVEKTFATNYLGHACLIRELQSTLCPGAAILVTASQSHIPNDRISGFLGYRGAIFRDAETVAQGKLDTSVSAAQQARDRYATSKLCCLLWMFAMARQYTSDEFRFIGYDPGAVPGTQIARELGLAARFGWLRLLPRVAGIVPGFSTSETSGQTLARLLIEPSLAGQTGRYLDYRLQPAPVWSEAKRTDWQDDVMNLTRRLTAP